MSLGTDTKQERINLRLKHSAKRALERAASFEGKTVSSFILSSALAHAEATLHKHDIMKLNAQDSDIFFDALVKPAGFNEKLMAAMDDHDWRVLGK